MVRFIRTEDSGESAPGRVSIPLWFDSYPLATMMVARGSLSLNSTMVRFIPAGATAGGFTRPVSQFHYGSIHTIARPSAGAAAATVSIPLWFDSYSMHDSKGWLREVKSQFHYGSIHTEDNYICITID